MNDTVTFSAPDTNRLDALIVEYLSTLPGRPPTSRTQVQRWIEEGAVTVGGKQIFKPGVPIKAYEEIVVIVPSPPRSDLEPYDFPLTILFEDNDILVMSKPPGISMHPGAGEREKTIANALVHHLGKIGGSFLEGERPGIVHRLDKDTSGVVVIGKNVAAHSDLAKQFEERTVEKVYTALVMTTPRGGRIVQQDDSGAVEAPLGRHPTKRTRMAVVKDGGRRAVTRWEVVRRFPHGVLLDVKIETGRTHQIRVHMDHIGSPIVGDRVYGDFSGLPAKLLRGAAEFGRQALHASKLAFTHPVSKKRLTFEAPLPADFTNLLHLFEEE